MISGDQVDGAIMPTAGEGWSAAALRDKVAAVGAERPLAEAEILPVLREIFAAHATPVRLMALAALAGLPGDMIGARQIAVAARADDAAAAAALCVSLMRQRMMPAELVVLVGAPDAASAELPGRAVTAALGDLADRGVTIRAVPWVTGVPGGRDATDNPGQPSEPGQLGEPGWLPRAAKMARSPWVVPWRAGHQYHESYLFDLACARECSQADAVGYAGAAYAFVPSLEPALASREFFASGDAARHGPRLFSVS